MQKRFLILVPAAIFSPSLSVAQPQYYYQPPDYYPPAYGGGYYGPYYHNAPAPYYYDRYYKPRKKKKKKKKKFGFGGFSKDSMRDFWDDSWKEPGSWGRMPGGWSFPEITVPNPVDTADDFEKGIRDLPEGFKQGDSKPKRKYRKPGKRYSNPYQRRRY